jgi:DUF1009 family protein
MQKLGLIAGGGALPATLARHCLAAGRPVFVLRLKGFAGPELAKFDGADVGLAQLGAAIAAFHSAECVSVCMAGTVSRPDFAALKPDARGLLALPGALRASRMGDDGLLRFLVHEFEKEGFVVEGAHQVMADLTLAAGPFGRSAPGAGDLADIERGLQAARAIGALDIGQAAVACEGLILALEAQEGTDAMLARIGELPANIRGDETRRRGVLAKAAKPGQDIRVDLPTIGPRTVAAAARAGLAGIAGETGRLLVVDREATRALADELGLFVFGAPPPAS